MSYLNVFQLEMMASSPSPSQRDANRSKEKRERERETRLHWERMQGSKNNKAPKSKRRET